MQTEKAIQFLHYMIKLLLCYEEDHKDRHLHNFSDIKYIH